MSDFLYLSTQYLPDYVWRPLPHGLEDPPYIFTKDSECKELGTDETEKYGKEGKNALCGPSGSIIEAEYQDQDTQQESNECHPHTRKEQDPQGPQGETSKQVQLKAEELQE